MTTTTRTSSPTLYRTLVPWVVAAVIVVAVFLWDTEFGVAAAFLAVAALIFRAHTWLAICTAAWGFVFLAVLTIPGPYDSPAGRAAVPILGIYAAWFLAAWYFGRRLAANKRRPEQSTVTENTVVMPAVATGSAVTVVMPAVATGSADTVVMPAVTTGSADTVVMPAVTTRPPMDRAGVESARAELRWPAESRLRAFVLFLLLLSLIGAALKFRGEVPPLFADNPDAAREAVRLRSNLITGLFSEFWGIGLAISLLRALTGKAEGRWTYVVFVVIFAFGAALGASKNSVLLGIVPPLVAALSVRRSATISRKNRLRVSLVVLVIGAVAMGAAVFLGGQRTLAGTGQFEDQFRAQYGASPLYASVGSLDLSLSSSVETFGRLWQVREQHPPTWGRYTLTFTGSLGDRLLGPADIYKITARLSKPFYMNTATFVAIPLLDYGPIGAVLFLSALGFCVGVVDRRLTYTSSPAHQLTRAFVIYFATFGVYELYPVVQPFWLALAPGLVALYLLSKPMRWIPEWMKR
ncbi:O-antigen polymerase [Micromonospora sp. NPDC049044]|uniref:O-antigen polymerase n=1 Tax=unclassified Micromonospora TaxID=2617518 RepID=UPI0033E07F65